MPSSLVLVESYPEVAQPEDRLRYELAHQLAEQDPVPGGYVAARVNNLNSNQHLAQSLTAQRRKYHAISCPDPPHQQQKAVIDRLKADCNLLLNSGVDLSRSAGKTNGSGYHRGEQVRNDSVDSKGREADPEPHVFRTRVRRRQGSAAIGAEFHGRPHGCAAGSAPHTRRSCGGPQVSWGVCAVETEAVHGAEVQCAKGRDSTLNAGETLAQWNPNPAASAVRYVVSIGGKTGYMQLLILTCRTRYW